MTQRDTVSAAGMPDPTQKHMRDWPMVGLMGAILFALVGRTLYIRVVAEDTRRKV